jgi:hypothetical protein
VFDAGSPFTVAGAASALPGGAPISLLASEANPRNLNPSRLRIAQICFQETLEWNIDATEFPRARYDWRLKVRGTLMPSRLMEALDRDLTLMKRKVAEMMPGLSPEAREGRELYLRLTAALFVIQKDNESSADELREFAREVLADLSITMQ